MSNEKSSVELSRFLRYLAFEKSDNEKLPSLADLSKELKISVATLREQLEVARALGLVDVSPKKGIRRLPYTFTPAVLQSLTYAAAVDHSNFFSAFADFRTHIETAYWYQAVQSLTSEDHQYLRSLITRAFDKLSGMPIQIPYEEHRELHLSIYRRLNNPFVLGVLEAYWSAYEAVGLNLYSDLTYLNNVWAYHRKMVEAICAGNAVEGYQAMVEHTDLLMQRARPVPRQAFE